MQLKYKHRSEVDMSDWDIDDDTGTLAHVAWKKNALYNDETIKIECEINPWIEENIEGECFYTFESISSKKTISDIEVVFYFKNIEDAFLFKLTWA